MSYHLDNPICVDVAPLFFIHLNGQRGFSDDALSKAISYKLGKLGPGTYKSSFYLGKKLIF